MPDFIVKPLDKSTWPDFARLVEKKTREYGAAVGVWPFTRRALGIPSQLGKNHWVATKVIDSTFNKTAP